MAIPIKPQAGHLRDIEKRLAALERKRPFIPPSELREFDEFAADLRDTIEILRRDLVNRRLTMSHMEAPGTVTPPARYALDLAERVPENAIWPAAVRLGLATSLAMFFVLSSSILLDQWISGQGSAFFMLGTMLVLMGFSVGWFGTILGIGLVISAFSGPADAVARSETQVSEHQELIEAQ